MKYIPAAVSTALARQVLLTRKHSPVIMFSAGITGAVAATVLACRATLKVEEVLTEAEAEKAKMDRATVEHPNRYTEKDFQKDVRLVRIQTIGKIGKLYAPAVGVGLISFGLLTGAHVTLTRRNASIAAAYAVLDKGFKEYRGRVVKELGEEKDREFRFGVVEKEIIEEGEHGHEVKIVKHAAPGTKSIYARVFDPGNKHWSQHPGDNRTFLLTVQSWMNDKLNAHGHLFLNDVYRALGMEDTKEGAVVGWVKNNPRGGDGYVDFGLDENNEQVWSFMYDGEKGVWLDFNVDGIVFDLI